MNRRRLATGMNGALDEQSEQVSDVVAVADVGAVVENSGWARERKTGEDGYSYGCYCCRWH